MESLDELIALNEDVLLQKVGKELSHYQAIPLTPKQLENTARRWLSGRSEAISERVCTSKKVYELVNDEGVSKELILAVLDLLISIQLGVSPLLVAVLLVKSGLSKFCKTYWVNEK